MQFCSITSSWTRSTCWSRTVQTKAIYACKAHQRSLLTATFPWFPSQKPAAPHSGSDRYNIAEEDDVIYLTDLQCVDYDNISQRIRLSSSDSQRSRLPSGGSSGYRARVSSTGSTGSSSGGYLRPQQIGMGGGEFTRVPTSSERSAARRPKDIHIIPQSASQSGDISTTGDGTTANEGGEEGIDIQRPHRVQVHSSSSSCSPESTPPDPNHLSEESEDHEEEDDDHDPGSPLEPFILPRGGGTHTCSAAHSVPAATTTRGSSGGRRSRYKCNDSMTLSDTSSGFHSDYVPDENSTDYTTVMIDSLHRKEALV